MTNDKAERGTALAVFERVYREHCGDVTAFFARRVAEPQTVADLTSDIFVQAMKSFATFDSRRGTARASLTPLDGSSSYTRGRRTERRPPVEPANDGDSALAGGPRSVSEGGQCGAGSRLRRMRVP